MPPEPSLTSPDPSPISPDPSPISPDVSTSAQASTASPDRQPAPTEELPPESARGPQPYPAEELPPSFGQGAADALGEGLDYTPAVTASPALEESCAIIAECEIDWVKENPVFVYLYASEPVYDMQIGIAYAYPKNDYETYSPLIEVEGSLYVPELSAGQAVRMANPYPARDTDGGTYYTKIAYTNSAGAYEVVLLEKRAGGVLQLSPTDPCIITETYYKDYFTQEQYGSEDYNPHHRLSSDAFREKVLAGHFNDHIPKGLCIAGGSLGDINGDGIEDALVFFTSGGYCAAAYSSAMPLFILTGREGGGYVVKEKLAAPLFTPYRSKSYVIAGSGYIDIVYTFVGGAACHHTQVYRFAYAQAEKGWFLSAFSNQPTFLLGQPGEVGYTEESPPVYVKPLSDFKDLPLTQFTGDIHYGSAAEQNEFDASCSFVGTGGNKGRTYTLMVKLNKAKGYYEGHIYKYYGSLDDGGFIQTIRGEYRGDTKFTVTADGESQAFIVQHDIWQMSEDDDAFYQFP